MRSVLIGSLALASVALAQPVPAAATAQVSGGRVYLTRAGSGLEPIEVGCVASSAVVDRQLYVACEDGRLLSFSLASPPQLVNELLVEGEVRSVFLLGNQAWVEVAHAEARPLRQGASQPVSGAAMPTRPAPAEMSPPLVAAAPPPPAAVMPAPKSDDTVIGPERAGGVFVFSASLHPMVPIGTLGVGVIADASITWHATIPFAARLRLWPVAAVTSAGASIGGSLDLFFDSRFFAAGLGIGGGSSSGGGGVVLSQHLRLGALDGLQFTAMTQVIATFSAWAFYGGEGLLQIPVRRGWALHFRGGGNMSPFVFGDLGMRIAIGAEQKPRLFLTPTVGFALVQFQAGPTVGLAIDYRL